MTLSLDELKRRADDCVADHVYVDVRKDELLGLISEVERLTRELQEARERARLTPDNVSDIQYRARIAAERDTARAEVERWKAQWSDALEQLREKCAEAERLREALTEFRRWRDQHACDERHTAERIAHYAAGRGPGFARLAADIREGAWRKP
jgi:predicted  nucleic acid-binding Zn-ribbon protein